MNTVIYAHKLDGDQKRHLSNAIRAVNGAQAYFSLPREVQDVDLPGLGRIPPTDAMDSLVSHLPAGSHGICVTSDRLGDNWFSHERRQCSLISAYDWEGSYAPPSLRCYLV
jgi:hypothetical protein